MYEKLDSEYEALDESLQCPNCNNQKLVARTGKLDEKGKSFDDCHNCGWSKPV